MTDYTNLPLEDVRTSARRALDDYRAEKEARKISIDQKRQEDADLLLVNNQKFEELKALAFEEEWRWEELEMVAKQFNLEHQHYRYANTPVAPVVEEPVEEEV